MAVLQSDSRIIKSVNREISDYASRIIANNGSISDTSLQAIASFINTLKLNNIWDKCLEIAPYAGNNLNAALVKLKSPASIQSTLTNIGFVPGDYSQATGLTGDTTGTKYLKTGFIPKNQLATSFDQHLSIYARNTGMLGGATTPSYIGSSSSGNFRIERSSINTRATLGFSSEVVCTYTNVLVPGHLIGSNVAVNNAYLFYNGSSVATDTAFTTNTLSIAEVYVFGYWTGTAFGGNSNLICGFHSIGYGITSSQASTFYNAVQTLQTALGRQV